MRKRKGNELLSCQPQTCSYCAGLYTRDNTNNMSASELARKSSFINRAYVIG